MCPDLIKKSFLITGCDGFLGKSLIFNLCKIIESKIPEINKELRPTIFAIDNGITSNKTGRIKKSYIRYLDANLIKFPFSDLPPQDYIVHMAGLASPVQYKRYPLETIDVAVNVTRSLLECARDWRSNLTFFSSSEIYGDPSPEFVPTPETFRGNVACQGPRACYDESKRLGETLCYIFASNYNLHTNIIRPFNVYGPGMSKHDYRLIPNIMRAAKEKQSIKVYGNGKQTRSFCYLEDAIDGSLKSIFKGKPGDTYNIGNPTPEISINKLVECFNQSTNNKVQIEHVPYPAHYPGDEPMRRCPDISRAKKQLRFSPKIPLMEGLIKTWEWSSSNYENR